MPPNKRTHSTTEDPAEPKQRDSPPQNAPAPDPASGAEELLDLVRAFPPARLRYLERGAEQHRFVAWPVLEVATRIPLAFEAPDDGGLE